MLRLLIFFKQIIPKQVETSSFSIYLIRRYVRLSLEAHSNHGNYFATTELSVTVEKAQCYNWLSYRLFGNNAI